MDFNRKLAYNILFNIEAKDQYSNIAINNVLKFEENVNEGFVRELVYGTLENKKYLEFVGGKLADTRFKNIPRNIRIVIKLGLYQLIFMNSIETYAVVNESVLLCKKIDKKRVSMVNAILRNYEDKIDRIKEELEKLKDEDRLKYLSIKYSFEPYIIKILLRDYGIKRAEKILEALNERPRLYIRTNLMKINRKDLVNLLINNGFEAKILEDTKTAIEVKGRKILDNELYKKGYFSIQDKASQKLIDILDPVEEDKILDVCAAPGGKSFACAERMNNKGIVSSRDIYLEKLKIMEEEAKRLDIKNIHIKEFNGEVLDKEAIGRYNKVICDVPCSGFGVIRRKPEIKYKKAENDIQALPQKQLKILLNSSQYLTKEGEIIYSTCTINRDENQEVIKKFLEIKKDFKILKEVIFTPDEDDIDGFYICKMKRGEK